MVNKYIVKEHSSGKKHFKYFKYDKGIFCRIKKKDMLKGKIKVIPFIEEQFYFYDKIGLIISLNRRYRRVDLSDWCNLIDL